MGIETEYGISIPGHPNVNAMLASSQIVNAYANSVVGPRAQRARWDYDEETPLRDARGFDMTRADADPTQLTDADLGLANAVLTNGARFYVDHAHPEYSSPEILTPMDAVIYDRAGEVIMAKAAELVAATPGGQPIRLYKNNTDNKGASYGTHENYLMRRETPFNDIVSGLIPFFVTRQVICGAGRVGRGQDGRTDGFQISQRADFFEVEVGLETTLKRPIINTRDEPHADPAEYRRLHVIVGDANMSEVATYLKMGMTSLVLALIENQRVPANLEMVHPVAEMHSVSHDPTLRHQCAMEDGRKLTALAIQREYASAARKMVEDLAQSNPVNDPQTFDVLDRWDDMLDKLESDPHDCVKDLDWVAKLAVLEGYRRRDNLDWTAARLQLVDIQYSDLAAGKGVARQLEAKGRLNRLSTPQQIADAVTNPPVDTRAWFRGECLRKFPDAIAAASWDSVVFDIEDKASLQRVPTMDPLKGTKARAGALLDACDTPQALLDALANANSG